MAAPVAVPEIEAEPTSKPRPRRSAALSPQGMTRRALVRAARGGVLLASAETLSEFVSRLYDSKFDRYLTAEDRDVYAAWVLVRTERVRVSERIAACRDPGDDKFLELAVGGAAGVIVSGDKDLLVLSPFRGIPIVTPAAFLQLALRE